MRLHVARGRMEFCTPQCVLTYRAGPERFPGADTPAVDGWQAWAVRWGP
ncbi:MAG: hypothetical protein JNL92_04645 [Opitutaceae bacterium]|nr:hypothetical protein [Opitutaceae bacterium]